MLTQDRRQKLSRGDAWVPMWIDSDIIIRTFSDWLHLLCTCFVQISNKQFYSYSLLILHPLAYPISQLLSPSNASVSFSSTKTNKTQKVERCGTISRDNSNQTPRGGLSPACGPANSGPRHCLHLPWPPWFQSVFFSFTRMGGKDLSGINSRVSLNDCLAFKLL